MKTFALSNKAFNSIGDVKPSLDTSLEQLRRFKEADTNLQQLCARKGIETPKLVAQSK